MALEWSIVFIKDNKNGERILLTESALTIGRDSSNTVALSHPSVSRRHATLCLKTTGPEICDEKSRNGIKVNGVPRQKAVLAPGDLIEIGAFSFKVFSERPFGPSSPVLGDWLKQAVQDEGETRELAVALPAGLAERHLAALYHICFWVSDSVDETFMVKQSLRLLRDVFQAAEAHYYTADLKLAEYALEKGGKRQVKFAPYLAEKVQAFTEAAPISAKSVGRLQEKTGLFNYLVAPLRSTQGAAQAVPFLVFARPVEWQEFTTQDRVLLQAVSQIWGRGVARTRQLVTLKEENTSLRQQATTAMGPQLLGTSAALTKLREQARKLALTNASILIQGETGSGKDVVAHLVHHASPRRSGPFVKVNCAAIPPGLIESELFGHVKGAFTDAKSAREGRFQEAHGGTLFLDEVGEMPSAVQAKVLRALETGEIERLGAKGVTLVDVRIIAATHRDLGALVKTKEFREDLYYRLNVLSLRVPPLREHPEDIPQIAAELAEKFCRENGLAAIRFSPEALAVLARHPWPGNVRELRNLVQRGCSLSDSQSISAALVREQLQSMD